MTSLGWAFANGFPAKPLRQVGGNRFEAGR